MLQMKPRWRVSRKRILFSSICFEGSALYSQKFYYFLSWILSLTQFTEFILLENISKTFKYPCAVDLKMGTRAFGDSSSKEKKERRAKRVNETTSANFRCEVMRNAGNSFVCLFPQIYKN